MNNNRNLLAAVSYITWFGFIIAFALGDRSDSFVRHHLNQALVINLAGLISGVLVVIPVLGAMVAGVVNIAGIVFDIMAISTALRGTMEPLPLIGDIHIIG